MDQDSAEHHERRADSRIEHDAGRADGEASAQAAEIAALRQALAAATAESQAAASLLRARQRELEQLRGTLTAALTALRRQLELVAASAAWRYGHRAARSLTRLRGRRTVTGGGVQAALGQVDRALELLGATGAPGAVAEATAEPAAARRHSRGDELLFGARVRELLGEVPEADHWPGVSVIVVSRSRPLTHEVLGHLVDTDYPALETILVDNASAGGEVATAGRDARAAEVQVVALDVAASFAVACNHGAERARGELLLFLNDDIRPIEPGWVRELVWSLHSREADVVGATLVAPRPGSDRTGAFVLEQRGVGIGLEDGSFVPLRRDEGADVLTGGFGTDIEPVAVSGACLLISRSAFASLGGFDEGYQYGFEDVDLCLRARSRGRRVVCSGRSVVMHEGGGSQRRAGREFRRINREVNRIRFQRLWAPSLRRDRLDGRLRGDLAWGPGPHLMIARTSNDERAGWGDFYTALELGTAAEELGWRVSYLGYRDQPTQPEPDDVDIAVVLTDRYDPRELPASAIVCAWIRNWTERWLTQPWLDRYDLLLASSSTSRQMLIDATGREVELFPLATDPRRFQPPEGDEARELDWVFTGNRWGAERALEPVLRERSGDRAAIYGKGWEQARPLRRLARGPVPYDGLPSVYGSAKLVLDDTAEPTLAYDAVNARVFDALATGTPVLTNCAGGVHELFDDEFPTWSSPAELAEVLAGLLGSPQRRAELARRYRTRVLAEHTYERRARHLRRSVREYNRRLSFCLKIGAPDWEQAERWGDLHYARALGRALRRRGHRWRVEVLPEWDSAEGSSFDVTIHLRGRSEYAQAPGQFNVLWAISHPETLTDAVAEGYDLVCVASESFAGELRERVSVPVQVLEQATDPRVFFPDPDPSLAHELVFVGNSRGTRRKLLDDLLPTSHDLAIWGGGWDGTDAERYVVADHVPNDELRRVYSSSAIVLCDHWADMRAYGFRSNRLFDALACGSLVISDDVAGLDGTLGPAVLTYRDRDELHAIIETMLSDPDERRRRTRDARERILAGETFDHRATDLVAWVEELRGAVAVAGRA